MKDMKIFPAIVAVGYNRPDSMRRLLTSIGAASYPEGDVPLIVSIDECADSDQVAAVAEAFTWRHGTKTVRRFPERQGLRRHILSCGDLSEEYGAVIVLEDDLIVSPSFYLFAAQAANRYRDDARICGTALYRHAWNGYAELPFAPVQNGYDVFFGQFSITWGQCWTDCQWKRFRTWYAEHEDRLPEANDALPAGVSRWGDKSWGRYFVSYIVETDRYYAIPYIALSTNASDAGEHNRISDNAHQVALLDGVKELFELPDFDKGIRYDVFFERIFDDDFKIGGIDAKEICVNLNGTKQSTLGKSYVLTTDRANRERIASFGLSLRPIDANITANTAGEDICLVRAESNVLRLRFKRPGDARTNYELYHFYWRVLLREGWKRFLMTLKGKCGVFFKRFAKQ